MFASGGPSVRFLTRYDGEVSEPLVGRQGSRVSMRVARGHVWSMNLWRQHWRQRGQGAAAPIILVQNGDS